MACIYRDSRDVFEKKEDYVYQCHYNLTVDERDIDPSLPYTIELFGDDYSELAYLSIESYFKTPEEFEKAADLVFNNDFIPDNT